MHESIPLSPSFRSIPNLERLSLRLRLTGTLCTKICKLPMGIGCVALDSANSLSTSKRCSSSGAF
uniref:Uncharacterized protein n=1 Tax=Parascaris equorum TaxID=6256 RepID=A0A914R2U1_PAREQ